MKKSSFLVLVLLFVLVFISGGCSLLEDVVNKAIQPKEIKELRRLAQQGDAKAQYTLASKYEIGEPSNYLYKSKYQADKWYRLAAEQGYPPAQTTLGDKYFSRYIATDSNQKAMKWYRLAAEQGYAEAQDKLGLMYDEGLSTMEDDKEAMYWYSLAIEQKYPITLVRFGYKFYKDKDLPAAMNYYLMAAEQGNIDGMLGAARVALDYRLFIKAYMWYKVADHLDKYKFRNIRESLSALENYRMDSHEIQRAKELALQCYDSNYKDCN
tara:strand:- start:297 stop:1097 length:801 start_codon:yes stop_codon:yes gene_type:complete